MHAFFRYNGLEAHREPHLDRHYSSDSILDHAKKLLSIVSAGMCIPRPTTAHLYKPILSRPYVLTVQTREDAFRGTVASQGEGESAEARASRKEAGSCRQAGP